jgi:hypothetical protein
VRTLKGKLTISRISGGDEAEEVRITLLDTASFTEVVEIKMDLATFASALFGRGDKEVTFDLPDNPVIGKERQYKTEVVFVPDRHLYDWTEKREKVIAKALKPHEVDGWKGNPKDPENGHLVADYNAVRDGVKGRLARVGFIRWV